MTRPTTPPELTPEMPPADGEKERALAWIGDAVLGLFARERVLESKGRVDAPAFKNFTSNAFLSALGRATRVEAEIGMVYQREGLGAAFAYIEARVVPLWRAQEARRIRQRKPR